MSTPILSPSLLSADFSDLGGALRRIETSGGGAVHIDVMDGHFVPPVTYGQPVIKSIRPRTKLPFDVHLMIDSPESQVESFAEAGADWLTFHYEATAHSDLCIRRIHALGKLAGIAVNPSTPVSVLSEVLPLVDIVLVMTVNPGWGGQELIPSCLAKVRALCALRKELGLSFRISVDGGICASTVGDAVGAGSDIVVSGSSFFKGELPWEY